jgi:hypothetical protein
MPGDYVEIEGAAYQLLGNGPSGATLRYGTLPACLQALQHTRANGGRVGHFTSPARASAESKRQASSAADAQGGGIRDVTGLRITRGRPSL